MSKVKNNSKAIDNKETLEALKVSHRNQLEALKLVEENERTQFGMFNRLKQIDRDFAEFNLTSFQRSIADNISAYFTCVVSLYNKHQKLKSEQVERKKVIAKALKEFEAEKINQSDFDSILEKNKPLTRTSYILTYENNGYEFSKTFNSEAKANEVKKALTVKNVSIEKKETEIKTGFSVNEALKLLQKAEKKFFSSFPTAESVTVPMLKLALNVEVTAKDKENVKQYKIAV